MTATLDSGAEAPQGLKPVPIWIETVPAEWHGSLLDVPLGRIRRRQGRYVATDAHEHVIGVYPTLHIAEHALQLQGAPRPAPPRRRRGPVAVAALTAVLGIAAAIVTTAGVLALVR